MPQESDLREIYKLMHRKLRSIQVENKFDQMLENEKNLTYVAKPDNYFFQRMCDVIFQSGVRGVIWERYEHEIRKEFRNYDVKKVAEFGEEDIERMLRNPKMLKNRRKIEACVHNAKKMVELIKEYGHFWLFLKSHKVSELIEKSMALFKGMNYTNACAFLRYVGVEIMKSDINVRRGLFRLGLTDSIDINGKNIATREKIQKIGKKTAKEVGEKVKAVDYVLFQYGAGEREYVKYAVCGAVPKCKECPLIKYCNYGKTKM